MSTVINRDAVDGYRAIYKCASTGANSRAQPALPITKDQTSASSSQASGFQPGAWPSNNSHNAQAMPRGANRAGNQVISFLDPRIMCCIPKTDRVYLFVQLPEPPSRLTSDQKFFEDLQGTYCKTRGLRRWFGLSCIRRITFLRFSRVRLDQDHADCHGPEGVPPINDPGYKVYDYSPKPPENPPVIPEFKLLHYFNNPKCSGTPTCSDFLKKIPKRKRELPDGEDTVWGLQLQLSLCHTMISILFLLFWLPSWGFFGWWMSKHPWDIQKGAVPATILAKVATVLLAILPANFAHYQNLPRQ
ncbi:hypothetical protein BDD12DRAFT_538460 [Trichophaea hybrida]|nr:hypothetical protein BDD12DRAFT_538460 [Trichophaea hybrida]